MLQKLFTNSVELTINNKIVLFNSLDDFEFALDARTAIPLDKITDTISASRGKLRVQSNAIDNAKDKLSKLVSQSPETSSGITMRLKSINSAIFSKDNGWRDIIIALNDSESLQLCQYKQVALQKYLHYLSNHLGMIKSVQNKKETNSNSSESNEEQFSRSQFRTISFDLVDKPGSVQDSLDIEMISMPKGKPVIIEIKEGEKIELSLSDYKCELHIKNGLRFIDYNKNEYPIKIGQNKIGRARECTIKLEDVPQGISRVHLAIINHDNKKLELTDLSSHGTYYQHFKH